MRLLLLSLMTLMLFSCDNQENKEALYTHPFGKKYNTERSRIGLPELKEGWLQKESVEQVFDEDSIAHDVIFWVPDFVDMNAPYHKYKKVIYEGDTIYSEEDVYYYYPTKATAEVIKIAYDFTQDSLPWTAYYITFDGKWSSKDVSKEEAEGVLNKWGL